MRRQLVDTTSKQNFKLLKSVYNANWDLRCVYFNEYFKVKIK